MNQQLEPWQNEIARVKTQFTKINEVNNFVNYDSEIMFATQIIQGNDYLMKVANINPASLRNSVINIASIGLSLNPATKYAYLVPRGGAACLDISYIGLIKLATDTGSIAWARAELVYDKDVFIYKGAIEKPEFSSPSPFDRGEIKGVYCVAKTSEGDFLSGIMSLKEINEIKDRSKASNGPWVTDFGEMAKKTIIKRESKTWPKTDKSGRFDRAIDAINQHEGIDFKNELSQDQINYQLLEESYIEIIKIITDDSDEESDYARVNELFMALNQNEQMAIYSKLRKYKPDSSRKYNTLLKDYLNHRTEKEIG